MRRSLLEVIFMSEKRKNLLFLLRNGPRRMEEILEVMNVSRHALLPQIKILSENGLVVKNKDICRLTKIGEILVEDMAPLVGTLTVLEKNYDYWIEHDLSSIPPHLLRRIRELGFCRVIEPDLNNMFEINKDLVEQALRSNFVMAATAFLHPSYPSVFLDFIKNNVDVSVIMTEDAIERLKADYGNELKLFQDSGYGKIYVYPDHMQLASLFIAEMFLMICLFDKKGRYDRKDLVFCNANAVHWGQELFEYYLSKSDPITKL